MSPIATDQFSGLRLVERVWRSAFSVFWRLPLLTIGIWVFYALVSSLANQLLPVAGRYDLGQRFLDDALYSFLHAAVFAPLVTAVMLLVLRRDVRSADLWSPAILSIAVLLAVREFAGLVLATPTWFWSSHAGRMLDYDLYQRGTSPWLLSFLRIGPDYLWFLANFLIGTRLILIFPVLAAGGDWRKAVSGGWNAMRGHYKFALLAVYSATLPYFLFEREIYPKLHRTLASPTPEFSPTITLAQGKLLLLQSGDLALRLILYAALAAWLYRAITERRTLTAP
jgi:hypothetical protein